MNILFIGESWLGSCARSLKDALVRQKGVVIDEVNEDFFFPKHRARWLRGVHRLLKPVYQIELYQEIILKANATRPDFIMVYKGHALSAAFVQSLRALGVKTVNVYPDCSPHAHGAAHRLAVGAYDRVISTKPFHPALWHAVYGYDNPCVFVPQGYDPALHLAAESSAMQPYDVVLVATWRAEYGRLMQNLGFCLAGRGVKVAIGGHGWAAHRLDYPPDWVYLGGLQGASYQQALRSGKLCLAPVTREVVINGVRQPGDEDSTRTYELAAAHTCFIHRRTSYVQSLYDEETEVPMFDDAEELAGKILHYLERPAERARLAKQAHARAVTAYSLDARAAEIIRILEQDLPTLPVADQISRHTDA